MILRIRLFVLILTLPFLQAAAQKLKKADKTTLANLETHIRYLSDDKLEGRRTGTPGEKAAGDYISMAFASAGLSAKGDNNGWLQAFEVNEGRQIGQDSYFSVNDKPLAAGKDFFPLAYSATGEIEGSPAIALQEGGEPWFLDLKDMIETGRNNPHFDLGEAIRIKAKECKKKGATALLLYNSSKMADNLAFDPKDRSEALAFPLIYITKDAKKKFLKDESSSLEIRIKISFTEKKRTGHNVIGYLDNGAAGTVILGAHYDHLGYGEDSNSLYRGAERQIHNGADDNASGVAGIIELARLLKDSRLKGNNYLFIAFSGEELGLYGSKYFVAHPTIDLKNVSYMINLDMIGRLKDSTHALTVGGFGTSPAWNELLGGSGGANAAAGDRKLFNIHYDSSGIGPSDHTSFYLQQIPVLFFFTGTHSDYHRPTDDADKINFTGELQVVKYVYNVVAGANKKGHLAFQKTRDLQTGIPRFTVTLGIMPDYTFDGSGIRADGVTEGRPAQKAGLRVGDVIIQLGDHPVSSMEKYMEALAAFKKGDATTVKFRRGSETIEAPIQF